MTERGEALPFILIAHIVRELARAAAYAHREHALVLRAIRADNVLVAKDGRVLIATHRLGLGEPEHAPSWEDSGHLAPECLSRSEFGIASDVYALGTLLYALLTGKNAPPGSAVPLEELEDERVPEPLIGIVARATHPAKGERYRDALLLAAKLESWMAAQEGPPLTRQIVAAFFARYLI